MARRSSPSTAGTRRGAGRSGPKGFSTARRCCSSTPPTSARSSSSVGERTLTRMAPHLTHVGVHDHGFNNVSTYGALWRLALEGRIEASEWERRFYALALKVSGAVQARRWTSLPDGGYIYSFNGAHSLFVDTIRSLRALALAHVLGHRLVEEQDAQISLLTRLLQHARATATYNVFYGNRERPVRRARARGARKPLQRRQRHLSRPEHATGILAVQHLDARAGVGDARLCRAARVPRDADRRRRPGVWRSRSGAGVRRRGARHVRLLYRCRRLRGRHPLLGHRRARTLGARRLGQPRVRSVQRSRARRQLRRRHRRPGSAPLRPRARETRRGWRPLHAGGPARARHAVRRNRPVPEPRPGAPGSDPALGVSLAKRMGPCARGRTDPARRIEPVGRLPCARGGVVCEAAGAGRAVSRVLRAGHDTGSGLGAQGSGKSSRRYSHGCRSLSPNA